MKLVSSFGYFAETLRMTKAPLPSPSLKSKVSGIALRMTDLGSAALTLMTMTLLPSLSFSQRDGQRAKKHGKRLGNAHNDII